MKMSLWFCSQLILLAVCHDIQHITSSYTVNRNFYISVSVFENTIHVNQWAFEVLLFPTASNLTMSWLHICTANTDMRLSVSIHLFNGYFQIAEIKKVEIWQKKKEKSLRITEVEMLMYCSTKCEANRPSKSNMTYNKHVTYPTSTEAAVSLRRQ